MIRSNIAPCWKLALNKAKISIYPKQFSNEVKTKLGLDAKFSAEQKDFENIQNRESVIEQNFTEKERQASNKDYTESFSMKTAGNVQISFAQIIPLTYLGMELSTNYWLLDDPFYYKMAFLTHGGLTLAHYLEFYNQRYKASLDIKFKEKLRSNSLISIIAISVPTLYTYSSITIDNLLFPIVPYFIGINLPVFLIGYTIAQHEEIYGQQWLRIWARQSGHNFFILCLTFAIMFHLIQIQKYKYKLVKKDTLENSQERLENTLNKNTEHKNLT